MQKIMLVLSALFILCMALVVNVSLHPELMPEPTAVPTAEPTAAAAVLPAETQPTELPDSAALTVPIPPANSLEPQRTAFPLRSTDTDYYKELFIFITEDDSPNAELQHYTPEQVHIEGNHLRITAEKRDGEYYSGRAETMLSFRYGTMTFRINCIDNPGFFPAVWMLPASGELLPEVDIYEHIGREPQYLYGVNHYLVSNGFDSYHTNENFLYTSPLYDLPKDYTITFEWTPESLSWKLNGEPVYTMVDHIPDEPMYLIVNMAVGGMWCGIPTEKSHFPEYMDVEFLDFRPRELYTR